MRGRFLHARDQGVQVGSLFAGITIGEFSGTTTIAVGRGDQQIVESITIEVIGIEVLRP